MGSTDGRVSVPPSLPSGWRRATGQAAWVPAKGYLIDLSRLLRAAIPTTFHHLLSRGASSAGAMIPAETPDPSGGFVKLQDLALPRCFPQALRPGAGAAPIASVMVRGASVPLSLRGGIGRPIRFLQLDRTRKDGVRRPPASHPRGWLGRDGPRWPQARIRTGAVRVAQRSRMVRRNAPQRPAGWRRSGRWYRRPCASEPQVTASPCCAARFA